MITRLTLRSTLATMVVLSATLAHAQVLYQTGFEAPTYSTTATGSHANLYTGTPFNAATGSIIHAQQGWGYVTETAGSLALAAARLERTVNSAIIQNSVVRSGAQALSIDGSVANQAGFGVFQTVGVSTTNTILDLSVDMLVTGASAQTSQWGLTLLDGSYRDIASLGFYGGFLVAGTGSTTYGLAAPTAIGYNNWASYKLRVNFSAKTMSILLNGAPVSTLQNLPLRNDITFTPTTYALGLGGQVPEGAPYTTTPERAFFDNVTVAAAPEPTTLALLSIGGTLVVLGRRRLQTQRREN
jgi:hypothetical protein